MSDFKLALIVDAQVDFMDPTGALPVPGADAVIPMLNEYLKSLSLENGYIGVVFTADTHDEETYPDSPEAKGDPDLDIPAFPPHCYQGTDGFKFAIDPRNAVVDSNFKRRILNKGVFNMWEESGLVVRPFPLVGEPVAYGGDVDRDEFFTNLMDCGVDTVEVSGCATDFCVFWVIEGLLIRGFTVIVYDNLVAGITQDIYQIAAEHFPEYLESGKLVIL